MGELEYLLDPYIDWANREEIPIIEGFGINLLEVETKPWPRMEANGAIAHVAGRGDYLNVMVTEIPPGGSTSPQQHIYEEVVYVLEGNGSTVIEGPSGEKHSFEWGINSLFALPLNATYRHYNGSGSKAAKLASTTSLPFVMKLFRNEEFVFENKQKFLERRGEEQYFRGEGNFIPVRPGRHMWETNFVPDLGTFERLQDYKSRGAGGSNIKFILADGTMHAHMSEFSVGTYKKGHRHGPDVHIYPVTGHGYSLLWYEGDEDWRRFDWKRGSLFAPADQQFHQHFNTSNKPARYLAVAFGSLRYPFTESTRSAFIGSDISTREGGRQIEYEDEDPRIRQLFEEELSKYDVKSHMNEILAKLG